MAVSVTSKGQVTIPKKMRNTLGIKTGSKVEFNLEGGVARMKLIAVSPRSRIEDGPGILNCKGPRIPPEDMHGGVAMKRARNARC